jgi:carboxylesterase type B
MLLLELLFITIFVNFSEQWEDNDDMTVQINDGKILGRFMTTRTGKPVKAFLGIPFAAPPVGNLRFKAPQNVQAWQGVKRTQQDGPKCVQIQPAIPVPQGQEDCLYLNVYVPDIENATSLPVMLWFYGGSLVYGEATSTSYGHDYIVQHDVIMVAGNYRVGALGFLSTEDENAQGNLGFKDQLMMMKWVRENIKHFGGDENSVTIWGGEKLKLKED